VIGAQLARQFPATNAGLKIEAFEVHPFSQCRPSTRMA
jgi:hypothetical protein